MGHDLFNASSTATWIECSWSALNAVPDAPKKAETVAAAGRGTARHDDMEAGNVPDVEAFIAQLEPGPEYREHRVKIAHDCGGTLDYLKDAPQIVTLLDGKFGKWDVPAYHNKQILSYGAAWLPYTKADWFRLVIYQPDGLDGDAWKQWVASRAEVEQHRERVIRAVADRSPPKPGPWCRWCNAFQQCPAMANDAAFTVAAMSRRPEDLTTDELVRLLRLVRALSDAKPAYDELLTARLKMGYQTPNATLKPTRSFRSWNDEQAAAAYLYGNFGAKGIKPVTPAQAEKLGPAGKQYTIVGAHKPEGQLKASY